MRAGCGLIGISHADGIATIAIIDNVVVRGELPGGHKVFTIQHVTFLNVAYPSSSQGKTSPLEEFQLQDNHFFSETYDATRLFPTDGLDNPDVGFVWNRPFRRPFESLGVGCCCVNLLQGICPSSKFADFGLTYIARRSVLNPGTRYAARGLNDLNSPGNEVECELIFGRQNKFWSVRWRRGSVPIRWKTTLSSSISAPQHTVDKDFFNGTADYFKSLQERFGINIPIRCVSLLVTNADHAEEQIKQAFQLAFNQLPEAGVDNVWQFPFDLNRHLHEDGSGEAMMDFLSVLGPPSREDGFTSGTLPNTIENHQQGLMRFNCADSLDRTNVATFYFAMSAAATWCQMQKTGLSKTPDADPNHPNLILAQPVIDFLASAFVDSGNVISFLYRNTPAIKVNAIRRFAPSIAAGSNDTSVTMQRRLQNVVNDPQRMKIIDLWTNPPQINWTHRMNSRYLTVVDGTIPRAILQSAWGCFRLKAEDNHLLICLPCPMLLQTLILSLFPTQFDGRATAVSISGGMSPTELVDICELPLPVVHDAQWCRFRIARSYRWALPTDPCIPYARFLSLKFAVHGASYLLGHLTIEAKSVFSGERALIPKPFSPPDQIGVHRFDQSFDLFRESRKTLLDALALEKARIAIGLEDSCRHQMSMLAGFNPWISDSQARIIAVPDSVCSLCGQPIAENTEVTFYSQSNELKGLICRSESPTRLRACVNCREPAEAIEQFTNVYAEERAPVLSPLPHFEVRYNVGQSGNQTLTTESDTVILEGENSLLWNDGGNGLSLESGASSSVRIFVVQAAVILKAVITATSGDFLVDLADGSNLQKESQTDKQITFAFAEPPISQKIQLIITAVSDVVITRIQLLYIGTEFPLESPVIEKRFSEVRVTPAVFSGVYTVSDRTDVIKFPRGKVGKFQIQMVVEKSSVPVSFIIACYLEDGLTASLHVIVPELPNGKKIWYLLEKPVEANSMKVFYVDRLLTLKPHIVRIVLE